MENKAKHSTILFVDDEPNLISALRRITHRVTDECSIFFASNAQEALQLAKKNSFDIIISDMRMPGMDGADLLGHIRRTNPETIRIVLSGQANLEATVRAIASTHQYLSKPLDASRLRNLIHEIGETQELIPNVTLRKHIAQLSALPCQSTVYEAFRDATTQQTLDRRALLQIVQSDLGLSAAILHAAMSMNPAMTAKIFSIEAALDNLTQESLVALLNSNALCFPVMREYNGLDLQKLSHHSLLTSKVCGTLATRLDANCWGMLAGLLHDLGKLIIAQCFGVVELDDNQFPPTLQERDGQLNTFGVSHAQIGAYLLRLRGFPHELVEAIATHHQPHTPHHRSSLSDLLKIANEVVHLCGGENVSKENELFGKATVDDKKGEQERL